MNHRAPRWRPALRAGLVLGATAIVVWIMVAAAHQANWDKAPETKGSSAVWLCAGRTDPNRSPCPQDGTEAFSGQVGRADGPSWLG